MIKIDEKPKTGWRYVDTSPNSDYGRYYTPHIPEFVDLGYKFRRETNNGTQVRNSEDEDWIFYWDVWKSEL